MLRLLVVLVALTSFASGQTVDEIVKLATKARGGVEKIRAMKTQRIQGQLSIGKEGGPLLVEISRPHSIREEFKSIGGTFVRVCDGSQAWLLLEGKPPTQLDAADVVNMTNSADLDGPLLDYQAKGTSITLAGTPLLEGRKHYQLVVQQKDGTERVDYIDAKTFLETKWEGTILLNGKKMKVESVFSDYRTVDGIAVAFHIDSLTLGVNVKQKIILNKVEINPPIDPSRFQKPQ